MTAREVYENVLVELNIENSPSFTTEEFNYVINKSVLSFVNSKYNYYATNQQLSDDLRVFLKTQKFNVKDSDVIIDDTLTTDNTYNDTSCHITENVSAGILVLPVSSIKDIPSSGNIRLNDIVYAITSVQDTTITVAVNASDIEAGTKVYLEIPYLTTSVDYSTNRELNINLPASDYLHLLSGRTLWRVKKQSGSTEDVCDAFTIDYVSFPTKRITFDMYNAIENNTYLKPASNRPYHQVFDNSKNSGLVKFPSTLAEYKAYQNKPRINILLGKANNFLEIVEIQLDYIKLPEVITLLDSDIYTANVDNSQVLELPDGLLNEVVKRCTGYLLEKTGNQRMQTQPIFNQETPDVPSNMVIGNPTAAALAKQQQQTQ